MLRTASYIALWLLVGSLLCSATACNKTPKPTQRLDNKATGIDEQPHSAEVKIVFTGAKPTASDTNKADLSYAVAVDDPPQDLKMRLLNPEKPEATDAATGVFNLHLSPKLYDPYVTSENDKECRVGCGYVFDLATPDGKPIASFAIEDTGNLSIVPDTLKEPYDVQLLTTKKRSLYLVFQTATDGSFAEPIGAFEYNRDPAGSEYVAKAKDGWSYSFHSPDGVIGMFYANSLGTLPENLTLQSLAEQEDRTEDLKAWVEKVNKDRGLVQY